MELPSGNAKIPIIATCSGHAVGGFFCKFIFHNRLGHERVVRERLRDIVGAVDEPLCQRVYENPKYLGRPFVVGSDFALSCLRRFSA